MQQACGKKAIAVVEKAKEQPPSEAAKVEPVVLAESPTPAKAAEPSGDYGCTRCRWSKTGCLTCNPEKMLRWAERQPK